MPNTLSDSEGWEAFLILNWIIIWEYMEYPTHFRDSLLRDPFVFLETLILLSQIHSWQLTLIFQVFLSGIYSQIWIVYINLALEVGIVIIYLWKWCICKKANFFSFEWLLGVINESSWWAKAKRSMHNALVATFNSHKMRLHTYILTSCHSVGYQDGGQSKRLQACTRDGLGL